MASVKIVLRKKINKDGTYPLAIRITKDRKSSFVHLGHHVSDSFWDAKNRKIKKSHPNSVRLNNLLSKKLAEAEDNLLDMEVQKNDISSRVIKSRLKVSKESSFFAQGELYLTELKKQGKYNQYSNSKGRISVFRQFLNDADISFQQITLPLLKKYQAYLRAKKLSELTIVNYLKMIQTIFNIVIDAKIVESKYYPFVKGEIRLNAPKSMKIGLSSEEVMEIERMKLPNDSYMHHARNIWLISFYFAGMRASDVLRMKCSDFQNGRLYYAMGKNAKGGSLKTPEKALKILAQYEGREHKYDLVFPDLQTVPDIDDTFYVQQRIAATIQQLDRSLKDIAKEAKITKKLTMHIARHTFGNISGDKIPIQMLQKLYRHTSIITTIGYQTNFIHKDADEALDAVIGF